MKGNAFNAIIHGYFNYYVKLILNKVQIALQEHHQIA